MAFDPGALDKTIEQITKTYGAESVRKGGGVNAPVPRIPSGSLEIDLISGGGIPIGRFTRLWGGWSSGKSLLCWSVIRHAQQMGWTCAYYNIEKQYDESYVRRLGVDVDKLLIIEGTIIEDIGTKLEALLASVNLHVLDSCTSAISLAELNTELGDANVAASARAWGAALKRAEKMLDMENNAILMVDQARENFGARGGIGGPTPEKAPGGRAMEHASSLTIHMRKGKWLFRTPDGFLTEDDKYAKDGIDGKKEPDGMTYHAVVDKSRVCRPLRSARVYYDLVFNRFDWGFEYAKAAMHYGIVSRSGAWYTLPDGSKVQGEMGLRKALNEDKDLRKQIRDRTMEDA